MERESNRAAEEHLERARAATKRGQFARAEVAIGAALRLRPQDPRLQRETMEVLVQRGAAQQQTITSDDVARLEYALEALSSDQPAHHTLRGHLAARAGDIEQARQAYLAADTAAGHVALSRIQLASDNRLAALTSLEIARTRDPHELNALNDLGVLYLQLERVDDAIAVLQAALEVKDNGASRLNLAEALTRAGREKEAVDHLRRAAVLDPASLAVRRRLAATLVKVGAHEEAARHLEQTLGDAPSTERLVELARIYRAAKRPDKAVAAYERALRTEPAAAGVWFELGRTFEEGADPVSAARAYQRYVDTAHVDPTHAPRVAEARKRLEALLPLVAPQAVAPNVAP
jgi:tetratricopeptide (TPR) repeat protein